MPLNPKIDPSINRIFDANINRAKEGLRVCEEITRFLLNRKDLTLQLKGLRHNIDSAVKLLPSYSSLLQQRDSLQDIGKNIHLYELKRKSIADIFFANLQRIKESLRVLEEFSKLIDTKVALKFKKLRYKTYEIEKESASLIVPLCNRG